MTDDIRRRPRAAALYAGGLLGPLGGGVVAPMLPFAAAGGSLLLAVPAFALLRTRAAEPVAAERPAGRRAGEPG